MSPRSVVPLAVALHACTPSPPAAPAAPAPRPCTLAFEDRGAVRAFVVGHRFSVADAQDYASYEASYRRHMDAIAPCLSANRPNLVAFPEDAGLAAWFLGRRGADARGVATGELAFIAMYAAYMEQAEHYAARFPAISTPRALTLALADVAWRAVDRTFGGIARDHRAWVITSANLPRVHRVRDGAEAALLADPEADGDGAYVADGPEVWNSAFLYAPDGSLAARTDKVFLTDEEEGSLDLASGSLSDMAVFDTPFGRVGSPISRDAFYPPVAQRLEDLGVELLVQPEAWSGWVVGDSPRVWLPDEILASGYTLGQKYRGFRHVLAPMLTGNLFDFHFDGQTWIGRKAAPAQTPMGFVGSERTRGWRSIGPWAFEDADADRPGVGLEQRREKLRAQGRQLLPGSGSELEGRTADSLLAADLDVWGESGMPPPVELPGEAAKPARAVAPAQAGHQSNPDGAADPSGRVFAAWTDTRTGAARLHFASSSDGGRTWSPARPVEAGGTARQTRPSVAASTGALAIAWQEQGAPDRVRVAVSADGGAAFSLQEVEAGSAAQWEPRLAFSQDGARLAVAWTDFRDGPAPRVRLATSEDLGATWSASVAVDDSGPRTGRYEAAQLQPALAWTASGPVVAWIDYRHRDWSVRAALSTADGMVAAQVSAGGVDREVLAADPALAAGDGTLMLAWDEVRDGRGHRDVRAAVLQADGTWHPAGTVPGGADDGLFVSRYRPSPAFFAGAWQLVFQDLTPGRNALFQTRADASSLAVETPSRADDTGSAAVSATRPRLVAVPGGSAVTLFEDDRDGPSRVYCSSPLGVP